MRIILDAGHGGISPFNNEYVTAGKRSPKKEDGTQFYEGVNNRILVDMIYDALKENGFDVVKLVDTWKDVPLSERVRKANELHKEKKSFLVSIHSDAFGNGIEWTSPKGITVFTSKGETKSDILAKWFRQELSCNFDGISPDRGIKEANFYILRNTSCPALLLELGFHTNREELRLMEGEDWKRRAVKSIVDACSIIELKGY
jgi:N-acetylmuramoyl-L-alanine amidase